MENSIKNIDFSPLLKFRLKTASKQKNQPALTSQWEWLRLQCSTYSTDERWIRGINRECPDHALLSVNCKMQVYFSLPSQFRKTNATVCVLIVPSGLNASISTQSFRSREFTLGLPFEIKNTQGKHILTNSAWSPQPASETHVSESVLRANVLQNLFAEQRYKITSSQTPTQNTDENSSRQQEARKAFEQRSKSS